MPKPHVIQLSGASRLVVARVECRGVPRVDVRLWYVDKAGELCPTRKGIHLDLSLVEEAARLMLAKAAQVEPDE